MNSNIISEYPEETIVQAAIRCLQDKIEWGEKPEKVIMDADSLLLVYDDAVDEMSHLGSHEKDLVFMFSRGKEKRIAWVEFERFGGLIRYIEPVMVPK